METKGLRIRFKMAYKAVQKVCSCFSMEVIAKVTKMKYYVNKRVHFRNILRFFNYSFLI